MAAVEFIQRLDADALSIDPSVYCHFIGEAREQLKQLSPPASPDVLDEAEAKAEELFLKAKEAFKETGMKATAAFNTFKKSEFTRKSLDKLNKFLKPSDDEETDDSQLAKALSMSILEQPLIEFDDVMDDSTNNTIEESNQQIPNNESKESLGAGVCSSKNRE